MIVNLFVIQTDGKTFKNKYLHSIEVSEVKIHDNFKYEDAWMEVVELEFKETKRTRKTINAICKENPYHHATNEEEQPWED